MNYLDDIDNVRDFYLKLCEYLETPYEKEYYDIMTSNIYILDREAHYMLYISLRFWHRNKNMRKFKKIYMSMNPHLMIYREEFKKLKFSYSVFKEEYDKFHANMYCLK